MFLRALAPLIELTVSILLPDLGNTLPKNPEIASGSYEQVLPKDK
jgi:hypothetical protein